jgi:hypothetical protein
VIATVGHAVEVIAVVAALIGSMAVAVFISYALVNVAVMLRTTTMLIDDVRKETVPLLHEVTGTVSGVNKELDRVDGMVESAGNIIKSAERISTVVESAVSSPLIKVAAFGAGASRALRRLRKKKER